MPSRIGPLDDGGAAFADGAVTIAARDREPAHRPAVQVLHPRLDAVVDLGHDRRGSEVHACEGRLRVHAGAKMSEALWPPKPNEFDSDGPELDRPRRAVHHVDRRSPGRAP